MNRWAIATIVAVPVLLIVIAIETVMLLAEPPSGGSTAEIYGDLFAHRTVRADVRGEPPAPPVVTGTAALPTNTPQPDAANTPSPTIAPAAPVARLRIPSIEIDAAILDMNLTPEGAMDTPDTPDDVAWYDFTGKPGLGGNAVFSAHVDWFTGAPAAFRDLDQLEPGDRIEAVLTDGTVIAYEIIGAESYLVQDMDMRAILAHTPVETVTLITCGGSFSGTSYSHRLVVRGVRVL